MAGMSGRAQLMWDEAVTGYDFGPDHPMDPVRLVLTRGLVGAFGLDRETDVVAAKAAGESTLRLVHRQDYIAAVKAASVDPGAADPSYGLGTPDDPAFAGMHEVSALIAGQSVGAAEAVWRGEALHAVNFAGGLHHAMPAAASGFCIYNDASLAVARLLELGAERVAYVDVDVHHGDGVQAAFWEDPRVLTISLHEHPRTLFPQTGWPEETGPEGAAAGSAVNVALPAGTGGRRLVAGVPRGGAGAAGRLPAAGTGDPARGRHACRGSAGASGGLPGRAAGGADRLPRAGARVRRGAVGRAGRGAVTPWWMWCRGPGPISWRSRRGARWRPRR
ncbi:hypothetical protein GCM10020295_34610 [Streptomyces cinereospinus]